MTDPDPGDPQPREPQPGEASLEEAGPDGTTDAPPAAEGRSLGSRLADRPVPTAIAGVLLVVATAVGAATLLTDDDPAVVMAPVSPSPSPSASASPTPTAAPSSPAAAPSPTVAGPDLDPSCSQDPATEAVCRFVLALQTGDREELTPGERELADVDTDLPDGPFTVSSCELEGDVTVLCDVRFPGPEPVAAGFRLVPANGEYDPATGEVVVADGEQLHYEVVEFVGMQRGSDPVVPAPGSPPASPSGPTPAPGELVLGGDELGVTRVGAPYREAVRAVSRVLGPPSEDPSDTVACVGAGQSEVEWPQFRLAITDDEVSGWLTEDPALRTPSGVRVGVAVADLRRTYGDRLQLFEASPDSGPGFTVEGVQLGGDLDQTGRVTRLWNRDCSPP